MITVLVVADRGRTEELDRIAAGRPSLELLHAVDAEEALDRLARNRRIDATLVLLEGDRAVELVRSVLEEDPGAPPLFVPAGSPEIAGTRRLSAGASRPEELLTALESGLTV